MAYIVAGFMAAMSFILNRFLLQHIGSVTVITLSPLVEELAKTLLSYYLGADILVTHITFGLIEAGYDFYYGRASGVKAALLSVAGHSLFGGLTAAVLYFTSSIWLALTTGLLAHLLWNVIIVRWYLEGWHK